MVAFLGEVGKELGLVVTSHRPEGRREPVISFGVEGRDFDSLLFSLRTPEQKARDERRMEREQWDCVPIDSWSRRPRIDPNYGSLRIYHLNGRDSKIFIVGDCWNVRVTKCYFDPMEKLTKDGRRKVHYSVDPISRLERLDGQQCLRDEQVVERYYRCGSNARTERIPCEVRKARFRVAGSVDQIVEAERITFTVDGKEEVFWNVLGFSSIAAAISRQQRLLGRNFDGRRAQRELNALPTAPSDFANKEFVRF